MLPNQIQEVYLILGGTGMLGQEIVGRLKARGNIVSVLDLVQRYDDVPFYLGDISEEGVVLSAIQKSGATCVIHTASPHATSGSADSFWKVNVEGTRLVISACLAAGVKKLVFTGSSGVVYGGTDINGVDETFPYTGKVMGPYISSKIVAEMAVLEANGKGNLLTAVLRPSGMFGPGDRQMMNVLWNSYKTGRWGIQIGHNINLVDYTFVANVADAHILAADRLTADSSPPVAGEVFFITNDEPMLFWDFSNGIWDRFDKICPGRRVKKKPTVIPPFAARMMAMISEAVAFLLRKKTDFTRFNIQFTYTSRWYNIDKAKKALGYKPAISLSEGMDQYVEWWMRHLKDDARED